MSAFDVWKETEITVTLRVKARVTGVIRPMVWGATPEDSIPDESEAEIDPKSIAVEAEFEFEGYGKEIPKAALNDWRACKAIEKAVQVAANEIQVMALDNPVND